MGFILICLLKETAWPVSTTLNDSDVLHDIVFYGKQHYDLLQTIMTARTITAEKAQEGRSRNHIASLSDSRNEDE